MEAAASFPSTVIQVCSISPSKREFSHSMMLSRTFYCCVNREKNSIVLLSRNLRYLPYRHIPNKWVYLTVVSQSIQSDWEQNLLSSHPFFFSFRHSSEYYVLAHYACEFFPTR